MFPPLHTFTIIASKTYTIIIIGTTKISSKIKPGTFYVFIPKSYNATGKSNESKNEGVCMV
jgi:hypothetical protein